MKKTIIFAAALAAMTACNKSLIENVNPADSYGFIDLGITADTEMVVTKAGCVMDADALATYNVTLKQGETHISGNLRLPTTSQNTRRNIFLF